MYHKFSKGKLVLLDLAIMERRDHFDDLMKLQPGNRLLRTSRDRCQALHEELNGLIVQADQQEEEEEEQEEGHAPTPLLLDWFEFGRMLYEQDAGGIGHALQASGVEWGQLPPGVQHTWAARAQRAARAFTEQLPPALRQAIKSLVLESGEETDGEEAEQ